MSGETEHRHVMKAGLATVLGVLVQAIDGWLARGCPYVEKPGRGRRSYTFDVAEVVGWRISASRWRSRRRSPAISTRTPRASSSAADVPAGLAWRVLTCTVTCPAGRP